MASALRVVLMLWVCSLLIGVANAGPKSGHEKAIEAALPLPDRAGPAAGRFDWMRFKGEYDFIDCRHDAGPIWDDSPPPGTFVLIEHHQDFSRIPDVHSLVVIRGHPRRVLALGWMIENIGEDLQRRLDEDTGKVGTAWQSYATEDGIYGARVWRHPHNAGWSTLQLRMDALGAVSYEMRQRTDSDAAIREETCTLVPRALFQPPS